MARVIVITSGKGGVGKSTITCNLGYSLANFNNKVLLIDADLGLKNLDILMNLESRIIYDIGDLIKGRCSIEQAIVQDRHYSNLFLLPASLRLDIEYFDPSYLKKIINQVDSQFDFILIDCPAGIEKGFLNAIKYAKEALLVVTLDKASIKDSDKVVGILKSNSISNIKIVINKYNERDIERNNSLLIEDVVHVLNQEIIGVIKENKNFIVANNHRKIEKNADFENLAMSILGIDKKKKNSIFSRIIKRKN